MEFLAIYFWGFLCMFNLMMVCHSRCDYWRENLSIPLSKKLLFAFVSSLILAFTSWVGIGISFELWMERLDRR